LRWIVIEGHHRHAAYLQRASNGGGDLQVPVIAHENTPLETAKGFAGRLNDRAKVRISQAERLDNAWQMVCMGSGSIKAQSNAGGVTESTISNMRKVKATLERRRTPTAQMIDAGWARCREWSNGKTRQDHSPDALEAMAHEMADELRGLNITTALKSPDIFARALEILSPELPRRLIESEPFWDALDDTGRSLLAEKDAEARDIIEDF